MIGNGPIKKKGAGDRTFVFDSNVLNDRFAVQLTSRVDPTMGGWKLSLN